MTDKLPVRVHVRHNPYPHIMPNLPEVLQELVEQLADKILAGPYEQKALAGCLLDPTAPRWMESEATVLALFIVGEGVDDKVVNAIAKACTHRDHGVDCGVLAHAAPHRLGDNSFLFGFSAEVNGTIGGGSALWPDEDRQLMEGFIADFNGEVFRANQAWEERHSSGTQRWRNDSNMPPAKYVNIARSLLGPGYQYGS